MTDQTTDTRPGPVQSDVRSLANVRLRLWVAAVLMAVSFAAGFLLRGQGSSPGQDWFVPPPAAPAAPALPGPAAPPLTERQIVGELPEGHPPLEPAPQPQGPAEQPSGGTP